MSEGVTNGEGDGKGGEEEAGRSVDNARALAPSHAAWCEPFDKLGPRKFVKVKATSMSIDFERR